MIGEHMNCPRCGKPVQPGGSFCMHCGQMLTPGTPRTAPQATGIPAYSPAQPLVMPDTRRRNTILAVVTGVLILIALLLGLNAAGILHLGGKSDAQKALQATGSSPANILQAKGTGPDPSLKAMKKTMPDDIYNWLNHLARIEKKKQALTNKELLQARELQGELQGAGGLTSAKDVDNLSDPDYNSFPSIDKATAMIKELQPDWIALKQEFESVPPPMECKPIAEQYSIALGNIIDTFSSIEQLIGGVSLTDQAQMKSSTDQARAIGHDHRRGIDGSFEKTDSLVQDVCDKYETKKWFKIDAHGGTGGILGF